MQDEWALTREQTSPEEFEAFKQLLAQEAPDGWSLDLEEKDG